MIEKSKSLFFFSRIWGFIEHPHHSHPLLCITIIFSHLAPKRKFRTSRSTARGGFGGRFGWVGKVGSRHLEEVTSGAGLGRCFGRGWRSGLRGWLMGEIGHGSGRGLRLPRLGCLGRVPRGWEGVWSPISGQESGFWFQPRTEFQNIFPCPYPSMYAKIALDSQKMRFRGMFEVGFYFIFGIACWSVKNEGSDSVDRGMGIGAIWGVGNGDMKGDWKEMMEGCRKGSLALSVLPDFAIAIAIFWSIVNGVLCHFLRVKLGVAGDGFAQYYYVLFIVFAKNVRLAAFWRWQIAFASFSSPE